MFWDVDVLVTCEVGVLKKTKGLLILMKGSMVRRLYVLQRSLVTLLANVTNSTMSEQETNLLLMRLGHLSGLNVLSKKGLFDRKKLEIFCFCEDCVYW